jgi:hypothetical protein
MTTTAATASPGTSGTSSKAIPPPRLPKGALRVVALGGIGEIGRNMTVYEYDGRLLVVDCGVLFPEDAQPGVDLILPDLRLVEDRVDDIDAVVLLPRDFQQQVDQGREATIELEEMLLTRRPEELFAAEDQADWDDWFDFFSRTREADGRRKGLVEIAL